MRLGLEYPIAKDWVIDFTYTRFWLKTKATLTTATTVASGTTVGLVRTLKMEANHDNVALAIGYRF